MSQNQFQSSSLDNKLGITQILQQELQKVKITHKTAVIVVIPTNRLSQHSLENLMKTYNQELSLKKEYLETHPSMISLMQQAQAQASTKNSQEELKSQICPVLQMDQHQIELEIKLQDTIHLNQCLTRDSKEFFIQLTSDYEIDNFKIDGIYFEKNVGTICFMPTQMAIYLTSLMKGEKNV